jgi:hypothetical protein
LKQLGAYITTVNASLRAIVPSETQETTASKQVFSALEETETKVLETIRNITEWQPYKAKVLSSLTSNFDELKQNNVFISTLKKILNLPHLDLKDWKLSNLENWVLTMDHSVQLPRGKNIGAKKFLEALEQSVFEVQKRKIIDYYFPRIDIFEDEDWQQYIKIGLKLDHLSPYILWINIILNLELGGKVKLMPGVEVKADCLLEILVTDIKNSGAEAGISGGSTDFSCAAIKGEPTNTNETNQEEVNIFQMLMDSNPGATASDNFTLPQNPDLLGSPNTQDPDADSSDDFVAAYAEEDSDDPEWKNFFDHLEQITGRINIIFTCKKEITNLLSPETSIKVLDLQNILPALIDSILASLEEIKTKIEKEFPNFGDGKEEIQQQYCTQLWTEHSGKKEIISSFFQSLIKLQQAIIVIQKNKIWDSDRTIELFMIDNQFLNFPVIKSSLTRFKQVIAEAQK